jgi:Arc/MetJ-type ribon-helix-helix transcriptional regulator
LRLSTEQRQEIEQLIRERRFSSLSEVIRKALDEFLSRQGHDLRLRKASLEQESWNTSKIWKRLAMRVSKSTSRTIGSDVYRCECVCLNVQACIEACLASSSESWTCLFLCDYEI